jgi:3-deoxy-manno-octulosonate cytidylyltransferase (CMP-KDO synthetase)
VPNAVAIIPARFDSTRFPGKPLAALNGKILIQHVYEHASDAKLVDSVLVATDDKRIFDAVTAFGGRVVMTSGAHESGTDRIAEAAADIECEIVVNVQGDEPFIRPEMIDDVIDLLYNDTKASISTLSKEITDHDEVISPNVVKVVVDDDGFALYFSRSPVPYYRDEWKGLKDVVYKADDTVIYKHIGIYGYRKNDLLRFSTMPRGRLERIEQLEQLRALAAGMRIKVKETEFDTFGIDTAEDLRKAENAFDS